MTQKGERNGDSGRDQIAGSAKQQESDVKAGSSRGASKQNGGHGGRK